MRTWRNVPYSLSTPHASSGRVPPPSILVRNCIVRSLPVAQRRGRARYDINLMPAVRLWPLELLLTLRRARRARRFLGIGFENRGQQARKARLQFRGADAA